MKLWDLSGYSENSNIQEAFLPKTSISGQMVCEILAQLNKKNVVPISMFEKVSLNVGFKL